MEQLHVPKDFHHSFFPRRDYQTPLEKSLRRNPAFIVQVPVMWHKDLHANVMNPPKLPPELIYGLLEYMPETHIGTSQGIEFAREYFRDIRDTSRPDRSDIASVAFEALTQQIYYLRGHHRGAA